MRSAVFFGIKNGALIPWWKQVCPDGRHIYDFCSTVSIHIIRQAQKPQTLCLYYIKKTLTCQYPRGTFAPRFGGFAISLLWDNNKVPNCTYLFILFVLKSKSHPASHNREKTLRGQNFIAKNASDMQKYSQTCAILWLITIIRSQDRLHGGKNDTF